MKWDGVRAVVYVVGGRVRVMTRNDRDVTATYPELRRHRPPRWAAARCVLDGEIVAFDAQGRPSFGALQQRMHVTAAATVRRAGRARCRSRYLAFDLLYLDGHPLTGCRYDERRALLEALEPPGPAGAAPPAFAGHGAEALDASLAQGLEGVVAKRRDVHRTSPAAAPGLDEGQERADPGGRDRRLAAREPATGRAHRRRCWSASRRTVRWSTSAGSAPGSPSPMLDRPAAPAAPAGALDLAVRDRAAADGRARTRSG